MRYKFNSTVPTGTMHGFDNRIDNLKGVGSVKFKKTPELIRSLPRIIKPVDRTAKMRMVCHTNYEGACPI